MVLSEEVCLLESFYYYVICVWQPRKRLGPYCSHFFLRLLDFLFHDFRLLSDWIDFWYFTLDNNRLFYFYLKLIFL